MPFIASMGIYVISKDVMINLLRDQFPGANDFGSEVIPGATSVGMRVCCILFSLMCLLTYAVKWNSYNFLLILLRSKLIYTTGTGRILVQLRLSTMPT